MSNAFTVKKLGLQMLWGVIALVGLARCGEAAVAAKIPCLSEGVAATFVRACYAVDAPGAGVALGAIAYHHGEVAAGAKHTNNMSQGEHVNLDGIATNTHELLGVLAASSIIHGAHAGHTLIGTKFPCTICGNGCAYGTIDGPPCADGTGAFAATSMTRTLLSPGTLARGGDVTIDTKIDSRAVRHTHLHDEDSALIQAGVSNPCGTGADLSSTSCHFRDHERFNQPVLQGVNAGAPRGMVVQETRISLNHNAASEKLMAFNNWLPIAFSIT